MLKHAWQTTRAFFVFVATTLAALLPKRYWARFGDLTPDHRAVFASAILTIALSGVIGVPGFLQYAIGSADLAADRSLRAVSWRTSDIHRPHPKNEQAMAQAVWGASMFSFFTFILLTPTGQLCGYLAATGVIRAISTAITNETLGDPVLTALDAGVRRASHARNARQVRRQRVKLEGPEMPDLLVSGRAAGVAADFVVIASRRKAGWAEGVTVVTPDKWFKLAEPFERDMPGGLRTLYPLTELRTNEVLRRGVQYELPPLTGK